jgi:hypothetical protein
LENGERKGKTIKSKIFLLVREEEKARKMHC